MLEYESLYRKIQLRLADVTKHRDKLIEEAEKLETTLVVLDRFREEYQKPIEDTPKESTRLRIVDYLLKALKSKDSPQTLSEIMELLPEHICRGSASSVLSVMKYEKMVKHHKDEGLWSIEK